MFGRKKREDDLEKAMRVGDNIAQGKGLTGVLAKGFMGAENAAKVGEAMDSARQAQATAAAQSMGLPTVQVTVVELSDTGKLVNFDPIVKMTVTFDNGVQMELDEMVVSKLQIPRPGDRVLLMKNPAQPVQYVFSGLAPQ